MTDPFATYLEPARPRNQLWRLVLGIVLIGATWLGGTFAVLFVALMMSPGGLGTASSDIQEGTTQTGMAVLMLTFGGLLIGTVLAALLLHRRGLQTLTGPYRAFFRDFRTVLIPIFVFFLLTILLWRLVFEPIPNLGVREWVIFIPIGLAGVALQTLAEEVAFRGYLMQQLAARFRSALIWFFGPALAFGLMHFSGAGGVALGLLIVLATGTFGLIAADLTRRRGNLGAAWGIHLMNNAVALMVLSTDGNLPGMALWQTPYGSDTPGTMTVMLCIDVITMVIMWRIALYALNRSDRARDTA